ncbi:SAYSvFN domain-containing protein 1 [Aphidius gifuensis]|uniref:SAYSvFN domain-containing protein 1 n=1 Tax=Aphidius gifuensis TaxID=684658 RepID=UPI001CDD2319|nr:SAYSvFN domain-containing protein 1 [Aphidius gifuensis]
MEEKLKAYRLKKRQEKIMTNIKDSIQNVFVERNTSLQDTDDLESINSEESTDIPLPEESSLALKLLYLLLWITVYLIALQVEFGAVYFIISALFFIWINTRSEKKKKGEISAYSVFNPNCEAIQGTINIEQLEKQMGYGVTHSSLL